MKTNGRKANSATLCTSTCSWKTIIQKEVLEDNKNQPSSLDAKENLNR
jgi:hypothetical protein